MPRSIRIEFPGAFYHVMARGNRREAIYGDDDDRRYFLKTLGEACAMTGWSIHAWVLMGNHYYLVIDNIRRQLSIFNIQVQSLQPQRLLSTLRRAYAAANGWFRNTHCRAGWIV